MSNWRWRPYQAEVIEEAIEAGGVALVALCRGAGKTATSVEIVRRMGAKVIMVTAPLSTHSGWRRTFKMFMPELPVHKIGAEDDSALELAKAGEPGVYLVGWEYGRGSKTYKKDANGKRVMVRKGAKTVPVVDRVIREPLDWSKVPLDAAIMDESARMANRKSAQTKVAWTAKKTPIKLCLSATPAGNRVEGVWSTLHFLWPSIFKHFGPFVKAYLKQEAHEYVKVKVKYGSRVVEQPLVEIVGEKRPGAIAKAIPTFLRRTEEEVHGDLPEVVTHEVEVELTATQRKIYKQFEERSLAWLEEHPVATELPVTKRARLLQTCLAVPSVVVHEDGTEEVTFKPGAKSSKADALLDILADLPEDEKVLVWTHSRKIIGSLRDRLEKAGYSVAVRVGGQNNKEREENDHAFLEGDAQVLLATIPTLGEGWDGAQHVCATEVWLSIDESAVLNYQAEGRLRRPGQTRAINRYFINAIETVEVKKVGRIASNKDILKEAGML